MTLTPIAHDDALATDAALIHSELAAEKRHDETKDRTHD